MYHLSLDSQPEAPEIISSTKHPIVDTTEQKTTEQEQTTTKVFVIHTDEGTTPLESGTFTAGSGSGSSTTVQQTSPADLGTSHSTSYQTTKIYLPSSTDTSQAPTIYMWPSTSTTTQAETTPERQTTTPYRPPIVYTTTTVVRGEDHENTVDPYDYNDYSYDPKRTHGHKVYTEPTTTTTTTEKPPLVPNKSGDLYSVYNPTQRPKKPNRIHSDTEERTAMIIGIVAGALIAVILVILLVLWLKSNQERSYKQEKTYNYGPGPNAALLGNAGASSNLPYNSNVAGHHTNGGGSFSHNGSMRNGSMSEKPGQVAPKPKPRNNKDVKEWYV